MPVGAIIVISLFALSSKMHSVVKQGSRSPEPFLKSDFDLEEGLLT